MRALPALRSSARVAAQLLLCASGVSVARAQASATPFVVPAWAFPRPLQPASTEVDSVMPLSVRGSALTFTDAQVHAPFDVADWHPKSHGPPPPVVMHGRKPAFWGCAYCHLPDGSGRPENAMLAGLPAEYIERQVADYRSRARRSPWTGTFVPAALMRAVADSATRDEVAAAARYFSALRPRSKWRVVEATRIPRPEPKSGLHFPAADRSTEQLGRRLIEMPTDPVRHERRDSNVDYVAYVPRGSLARGRALATSVRADGTAPCASCHGPQLRGLGAVPPIAGRSPSYILRQLMAFRTGARAAPEAAPMREIAAKLDLDDMIAAAAYVGSRRP